METFLKVIEGSALTTTTKQTKLYKDIADKGGLISIVKSQCNGPILKEKVKKCLSTFHFWLKS